MAPAAVHSSESEDPSKKMLQELFKDSPLMQSIELFPIHFGCSGSPTKYPDNKHDYLNAENNSDTRFSIPGVDCVVDDVNSSMDLFNDESPYNGRPILVDEIPCINDEVVGLVVSDQPLSSLVDIENKWGDTSSYASEKNLQFWLQNTSGSWDLVKVLSSCGTAYVVSLPNGELIETNKKTLLPANPDILVGVDDLMQLSYLNEPSVLYNLQYRYKQDMIYTKAGPVLVAINPFKKVPLYGNSFIEAYRHKSAVGPHVYAIADTAICEMIRDEVNQSIIISGESGAGKTETAKIAMQYLSALGGGSGIEYEISKTNPILEAFGNAKTIRNDNSSRFGKLIEIHFSGTGKISGAIIQTFLLEKSRVVQCAEGERSYHIFYQLCAGAPPALREKWNLKSANEYNYLRQSDCFTINCVDDAEEFHQVMEALNIVHVSKADQESVFSMLAAVLWLGNISFSVIDNENHVEAVTDEGLISVASLFGCDVGELKVALSTRKMRVGNDSIVQKLTLSQAIDARDALGKSIYACLFEWLVQQINKSLALGKRLTGRSISILDIYGFESLERNSFEQFCINYANERLQQHFNRHLFKLEQEEYVKDGIDWAKIDFEDNQDCLNLFEKKPLGLLSLLDEESMFPNGTDLTFAEKLEQHLNKKLCFKRERGKAFSVSHYAGEVIYDSTGFLEKNRDLLHIDSIHLLASSACYLPQVFASNMLTYSEKPVVGSHYKSGGVDSQKLSIATQFKVQLFQLMRRLENTTPHFIRCIKPNNCQSHGLFEQRLVLQQLRCCGVLELVRISRTGFPTRMSHQKFARRYGFLLLESVASQDPLSVSVAILNQFKILPEMFQVGYTKLFFRMGQIGVLEDIRNHTLRGILCVQSCFRGHRTRCHFKKLREAILILQSFVRSEKTRKQFVTQKVRQRAVVVIQRNIKERIAQKKYRASHDSVIQIQSAIRGWLVRRHSGDVGLLKNDGQRVQSNEERGGYETDEVVVKSSILTELQRRALKSEAALKQKEEENEILYQRLQQYDSRWSEYETKMKSMEELWQKQMRSLQSSLSIAKNSLTIEEESEATSEASVNAGDEISSDSNTHSQSHSSCSNSKPRSAGLSVIKRLGDEFEARSKVFGDDASFLVEVKSGEADADFEPDHELRRLNCMFEAWKRDYGGRLRETKLILRRLGSKGGSGGEKMRKKWWGRLSSSKFN